jgi:large subunit ribosomal protein L25
MAKSKLVLKAEKRKVFGRKVKSLRKQGVLPGNVYGKAVKSEGVEVPQKDFETLFKEAGETGVVELQLGKASKPVLVDNVQLDPVTDQPIHVDFRQIDLKEKVKADIPVALQGVAPAEKEGKGTLVQQLAEIEVEALPTDLPSEFAVDVSKLAEVDDAIFVKDLKYDQDKVTLVDITPDAIVANILAVKEEKEEVPVPPAEGEVPEAEAGKEAPAEGQPAPEAAEEKKEEAPKKEEAGKQASK